MAAVAFVFAGQGAQYPGMGRELYEASPAARRIFDRAEAIRPGTIDMCFNGPAEELNQTINTQPCLFTMDWACAAAAVDAGVKPDCCAGFSLGEVAAAGFAGVMDFDGAFRFVIRRGEAMQACAEKVQGAMGAVLRLNAGQVEEICREFPEAAYPVNYNCPGQTVVACRAEIFDALSARISQEKGRMMRLKVSGAFHTPWMADASRELAEYLADKELKVPAVPLYANVNARPYGANAAELLSRQVCNPVRWQQTIEGLKDISLFVELGAGKTLSGLIRKTLPDAKVLNVEKPEDIEKLKEACNEG
ncbi:MAG: ACP S-malonyltransferase [Clostridia bacterium]|nr:ACP S-malonyltransferase [Clostridia bacterium]